MRYRTLESDKIQRSSRQQTRGRGFYRSPRSRRGLYTPRWSVHSTRRKDVEQKTDKTLCVTFKNDHTSWQKNEVRRPRRNLPPQFERYSNLVGTEFNDAPSHGLVVSRTVPGLGRRRGRGRRRPRGFSLNPVSVNIPNERSADEEGDKKYLGQGLVMNNPAVQESDSDVWRLVEREDESSACGSGGAAMDVEDGDTLMRLNKDRVVESPDEEIGKSSHAGSASLNSKFTNIMLNKEREVKLKKSQRKLERKQMKEMDTLVV